MNDAQESLQSLRSEIREVKHDLNNILSVATLQVEMLEREFPGHPKVAKVLESLDRLRHGLKRLETAPPESEA